MFRQWARGNHKARMGSTLCLFALLILAVGLCWPAVHGGALTQGDGLITYGEGTVATPRYRTLSGITWSAENSLPTAGGTNSYTIIRASPVRNELIAGVVNSSGTLTIYRWNGSTWSTEWSPGSPVGLGNTPRFDIAYEQSSGNAVVLYSRFVATTNEMAYRAWNGSTWTSATNYDAIRTSGVVSYIRLVGRPGTDEVAAAWGDANFDLSANYFDGANSVWKSEPTAALATSLTTAGFGAIGARVFDLAFEQTSGKLLVVWGTTTNTSPSYVSRAAGVSGAWGTVTVGGASFNTRGLDMQLASEPGTNYIAYSNISNANGGEAAMWTGSAWANFNNYDTTVSTLALSLVRTSVEWLQSGGQSRAVVVYDDSATSGVDWLYFNKNTTTWSAVQTPYAGAPAPSATGAAGEMYLYRNPFNTAEGVYVTVDGQGDLFTKRLNFDGTNLNWSSTEPGGVSPETSVANTVGWAAAFAFNAFAPLPPTLSVDIVDAGGATVSSPSLSMSSVAASGVCQTSTGTLGVTAQQIQVNNTTITPGWSLSIAATAGATTNWSSGGATYDFNDGSGGTAGCADGGDADSIAGQLSMDPSASTITPGSGCSSTGLTKGTSSAFAQGTTNNITLLSASTSADTTCSWNLTGISLSQKVPELQPTGSYSLPMTITIVAT